MAYAKLEFERYRGAEKGWFEDEFIEMVRLTDDNFTDVREWLENHGCKVSYWTNEAFVIGLWVTNT